jgi:hypothetical protein
MFRAKQGILGLALVGAVAGMAATARAQMPAVNPGQTGFQPIVKPNAEPVTHTLPPPALPGASPGRGAAPADKNTLDMAPNEALFDAINRGDIAQARDAINRGAELNARSVLGMTPLELSVDLSRNDITFLLLSLRGSAGPRPAVEAAGKPQAHEAALVRTASKPPAHGVKTARATSGRPAAQPVAMRQYAGSSDPGTPDPQAGFLGFGRNVQ